MSDFVKFLFYHYYRWPLRRKLLVYFLLFLYGITVSYLYDVLGNSHVDFQYFALNAELFMLPGR